MESNTNENTNETRPKHNPQNLSDEIIGTKDGWRLLDEDEVLENYPSPLPFLMEIEVRNFYYDFSKGYHGNDKTLTYRTKLSRAELRAARGFPPEQEIKPEFKIWTKENPVSYKVNGFQWEFEYANIISKEGGDYYARVCDMSGKQFSVILDESGKTKYGPYFIQVLSEEYHHKPEIDWTVGYPTCAAMDGNGIWNFYYGEKPVYSENYQQWELEAGAYYEEMKNPPKYSGHARDSLVMFPGK